MYVLDFAEPLVVASRKSGAAFIPNEEALVMIMSMGFNKHQATKALKATVSCHTIVVLINTIPHINAIHII